MFELLKTDGHSQARLGRLTAAPGVMDTPVFMSVGTQGSVKAIDPRELREMGTQIILGNPCRLNLRPGLAIICAAGSILSASPDLRTQGRDRIVSFHQRS